MLDNANIEELVGQHISSIMKILGIEVTESNKDTPKRIAKMYNRELFKNRENTLDYEDTLKEFKNSLTLFPAENQNPVTLRVPFNSVCEHHWLPFMGEVTITYIPDEKIIGLSKIPRVVKFFSKKPQLQERLTNEIGEFLVEVIKPKELSIRMVATHTCVTVRGVESPCETSTVYEYYKEDKGE